MKKLNQQNIHEANRTRWNAASNQWYRQTDGRGLLAQCHQNPGLVLHKLVLDYCKGVKNKKVCVLGSGDNEAVFAFTGMGAKVTSVDISQNQLDNAAERADKYGLEIDFVQSDVIDLSKLLDSTFDIVFTGGHVAVWVSDIRKYYSEASRILKPGGIFMVDEYHPFRRVWEPSDSQLTVGYPYFDSGPFEFEYDGNVLEPKKGQYKTYEFHWTVGDMINSVIQSGCKILKIEEYTSTSESWEVAPVEGLPGMMLIIASKEI